MHLPVWLFSKLGILPFMKGVCFMKVTARNLLLSACGAAATALLVSQGVSDAFDRRMVGAALDRQEPELIRKKNLQGENGPDGKIMAYCRIKQRELEQKPHRVIHIQGKDGTTLVGHLFLAVERWQSFFKAPGVPFSMPSSGGRGEAAGITWASA